MPKFNAPEPFNFNEPGRWREWKSRFERYRIASELDDKSEGVQVSTLIYVMGKEAEGAFKALRFTAEGDDKKYEKVIEAYTAYFQPKVNVIHERAMFNTRAQAMGETAENYIRDLYILADMCDYKNVKDEMIRDRLVVGIYDKELSLKLQMEAELTLDKAISEVKKKESVKQQMTMQGEGTKNITVQIDKIKMKKENSGFKCENCDSPRPHTAQECPARNIVCFRCEKKGHFMKNCPIKKGDQSSCQCACAKSANNVQADAVDIEQNGGFDFYDVEIEQDGGFDFGLEYLNP